MDIPQEELHGCQALNPDWPHQGVIEFHNVTLRYLPSLPAALCDINFTVGEGMQVSIIYPARSWWFNFMPDLDLVTNFS